ncbi:hypothetical protein B0H19DRAFT_1075799 [Mycena capillaripes]|nr:hypothetical protein B0H19DRAFT_1075799 [Mycena capillaripes]
MTSIDLVGRNSQDHRSPTGRNYTWVEMHVVEESLGTPRGLGGVDGPIERCSRNVERARTPAEGGYGSDESQTGRGENSEIKVHVEVCGIGAGGIERGCIVRQRKKRSWGATTWPPTAMDTVKTWIEAWPGAGGSYMHKRIMGEGKRSKGTR